MADLKDELSAALAAELARELAMAWPEFPRRRFTGGMAEALAPLALTGRVETLADRLADTLPGDFGAAAEVLWGALQSSTFTGWMTWPCTHFVARAGIDQPDEALPLLAGLTPRWSSEFAVRPFIERHPEVTYRYLKEWAGDPDEHVRRLVSEGTRPRLPWGRQLRALVADPTPNIELLDRLVDDPSPYVRRSVGNHLNDISKDHPDLAIELARRWPAAIARHGMRTLVKRGHPEALALLGVAPDTEVRLSGLSVDRPAIAIGEAVTFTFTLELVGNEPAEVVVDYRVHYVGGLRPKVFKLSRRRLVPGTPTTVARRHRFEHVSIRRIRPGLHRIDVQVNGRVLGGVDIDVTD